MILYRFDQPLLIKALFSLLASAEKTGFFSNFCQCLLNAVKIGKNYMEIEHMSRNNEKDREIDEIVLTFTCTVANKTKPLDI